MKILTRPSLPSLALCKSDRLLASFLSMNLPMRPRPHLSLLPCLLALLGVLGGPLAAQAPPGEGGEGISPIEPASSPKLELGEVGRRMAEVDASDLEDSIKEALKAKYKEAVEKLKAAAANRQRTNAFHEAFRSAPGETAELRRQLADLPSPEDAGAVPEPSPDVDALRKDVQARRAALSALEKKLAAAEDELSRGRARPVEIGSRLPLARSELAEATAKIAAPGQGEDPSPGRVAENTLLEAGKEALEAEVEMLVQEQLSQAPRENLALARRDLLARQAGNNTAALAVLEDRLNRARMSDAERLAASVDGLISQSDAGNKETRPFLEELRALSGELRVSARKLEDTQVRHGDLQKKLKELAEEFRWIKEKVELGGLEGSAAQILMELQRMLPDTRPLSYSIRAREQTLRELRLAGFRVEEKLRSQKEQGKKPGSSRGRFLEIRADLLGELRKNYQSLVRETSRLDADERAYRNLIEETQAYLSERLFWRKSSAPVGYNFFADLPAALQWVFDIDQWRKGLRALVAIPFRHPLLTFLAGAVVLLLQFLRPRIKKSLLETGNLTRRISTDRYAHTLRAFFYTLLLAVPVPLALGFVSWALLRNPDDSVWVRGLGEGLAWSAHFLTGALAFREICRPGGLGIAHLGWGERFAGMTRAAILRLIVVYMPATLLTSTTLFESSSRHVDSLGRLSWIVGQVWIAWILGRMFRPSDGILSGTIQRNPGRLVAKGRHLWHWLAVAIPLALVILALVGYFYTALTLSVEFQATLRLIALGVLVYGLLLRWFMIKERRLALEEAPEERRARKEAAANPGEPSDEAIAFDEESLELDLAAVGEQIRSLLRSLVTVGVVVAIWILLSKTLPIQGFLTAQSSTSGPGLFNLLQAAIVVVIATTLVRNLPGLLDLGGLRNSGLDPGTRYAVSTICQYVAIALAIILVFRTLRLDWSQFGWIAAALSVGLGFGLQEVVANFVCGIILLFERPIRVGDVVTVGTVTGTVTRIQMRATTITNYDRQDFVVPNKEFITGSLINWTLTSKINRIVIPVGVAYGSDAARARDLLLEVANDHPLIMDDPAPVASFEAFADSSLNLSLRCYLPDMDNRLRTTTELHSEIDRRFKEAGIEIAFPQQDIHLRSGWEVMTPDERLRGMSEGGAD